MNVLLGMLTAHERAALDAIARECGGRFRPLAAVPVSRRSAGALAKLDLVEMRRGRIDGALLVRLSGIGAQALAPQAPTKAHPR